MNITEKQNSEQFMVPSLPTHHRAIVVIAAVWHGRRWLAKMTILGLLVTTAIAFLIPNEYESTAQLMPPDAASLKSTSTLDALSGNSLGFPSGAASFLSQESPGQTAIGILTSVTTLDDIIDLLDLRKVYWHKRYLETRKELTNQTTISQNRQSGIITITVKDRDPYRARNIAKAYIGELNKRLSTVSTSEANRERLFLEARLGSLKTEIDATSTKLSQFSSRNATLNPETEGAALIDAASKLQAELIAANSELLGLKAAYSENNVRVRSAQAQVDELHKQLGKLGGGGYASGTTLGSDQLYPSIRELPILGVTYSDLRRQLTMQETVYALLTRQYELAKIQEAKEIPAAKVLDQPDLAEKKSTPHRLLMLIFGGSLSVFLAVAWTALRAWWQIADSSDPGKAFVIELAESIRDRSGAGPLPS